MGGLRACLAIRMPSAGGKAGLGTRRARDPECRQRTAATAPLPCKGRFRVEADNTVNGDCAFALPTNAGGGFQSF